MGLISKWEITGAASIFQQQGDFLLAAHAYAGMRYEKAEFILGER